VGGGGGVYEGMGFEEKRFERFLGGGRGVWYGTNVRISSIFSRLKRIVSRGRRRRSIIYLQLSICQKKKPRTDRTCDNPGGFYIFQHSSIYVCTVPMYG